MSEFVVKYRSRLTTGLIALLSACALAVATVLGAAAAWATTVLVVPGTGTQNPAPVPGYQDHAVGYYVAPTGACDDGGCTATPVPYLAQFWPIPLEGWGGLEGAKWDDSVASGVTSLNEAYDAADKTSPIVIFGYSQGGTVVSAVKKQMSEQPGGVPDDVSFVLIGNASRPNGGLFTRPSFLGHIPFLDVTFGPGTPTDTSTTVNTTDIAFQYDGVTDFPRYPANLLATANALAGFWYVHGKYLAPKADDPATETPVGYTPAEVEAAVAAATANCSADTYCQVSGDTRYITLPAKILPIMLPLLDLGAATGTTALVRPFVDLTSPLARVLIETGYDRADYGKATPFGLLPSVDPLRLTTDLAGATVNGIGEAVTGTGDASRYLAPKPAEAPSETTTASSPAPAPTSSGAAASLLELARSVTSERTPEPSPERAVDTTATSEPTKTSDATPTATEPDAPAASSKTAGPTPAEPTESAESTDTAETVVTDAAA